MKAVPLIIAVFVIAIGAFLVFGNSFGRSGPKSELDLTYGGKVTVFKSMSCGCCSVYASYLQKKGLDINLPELTEQKLTEAKDNFKIPSSLRSCHTSMFGNYFVEGHIPLEAVEKLLLEKPDVAGIAMPGMPSGSPGMPGSKNGQFVIYAINKDGSSYEFVRV